jgi:hypothetical protein
MLSNRDAAIGHTLSLSLDQVHFMTLYEVVLDI